MGDFVFDCFFLYYKIDVPKSSIK